MKKVRFLYVFLILLLCVGFFANIKPNTTYAQSQIDIDGPSFIEIKNMPNSFSLVATLSDSTFSGSDIVWFKGTSQHTQNIEYSNNTSTLTIYKSEYENITQETSVTYTAKISSNQTIQNSITINFVFTEISAVNLELSGPTNQIMSNNIRSVILTANIVGAPPSVTYQWFIKSTTNKFEKFGNNQSQITYTPSKAGEYTFIVTANGVVSNEVSISVLYKEITALSINVRRATQNTNGFDRYTFAIDNISSSESKFYDISKINWYDQHGNLLQTGGLSLDYQISQPTSLVIYAKYGSVESNKQKIEVTVNRNKDILIGLGIAVGVMAIITVIGIVINVKKDKVW